jgi:hypothetical protein
LVNGKGQIHLPEAMAIEATAQCVIRYSKSTNTIEHEQSSVSSGGGEAQKVQQSFSAALQQARTVFKFKTREAGIFYLTYEDLCVAFIQQISGIEVEKLDLTLQKPVNSVLQTTVTLLGEGDGMSLAKDYLKRFQTSLAHTQIFFPNTSAKKYKQLHELKVTFENILVGVYDPLLSYDMISVRIKPPMSPQGMKHTVWPTDVWVTICGPSEEYIAEVEQLLTSLKYDFITHTVAVYSGSPLRERLQEKSSRLEFLKDFNILGARLSPSQNHSPDMLTLWINSKVACTDDFLLHLNERLESIPMVVKLDTSDEKEEVSARSYGQYDSNASDSDFLSSIHSLGIPGDIKSISSSTESQLEDDEFNPFNDYFQLSHGLQTYDSDLMSFDSQTISAGVNSSKSPESSPNSKDAIISPIEKSANEIKSRVHFDDINF